MTTSNDHLELIAKLTEGISTLASSSSWQSYLETQARFHRYSYGNVLLIASQRADATRVAGFGAWKRLGRHVLKGEKAIFILAPMVARSSGPQSDEDQNVVRGFKYVPVFDVSQTDGDDLPDLCSRLVGDDSAGYYRQLVTVARGRGFHVEDHAFSGTANGDCCHALQRIRVEVGNSPIQRVRTLVHEIAHGILHEHASSRALAELEAESVAYVVCQQIGIDSGAYSFGYVTGWAGGSAEAVARIRTSCERIQKTAAAILGDLGARSEHAARSAPADARQRGPTKRTTGTTPRLEVAPVV